MQLERYFMRTKFYIYFDYISSLLLLNLAHGEMMRWTTKTLFFFNLPLKIWTLAIFSFRYIYKAIGKISFNIEITLNVRISFVRKWYIRNLLQKALVPNLLFCKVKRDCVRTTTIIEAASMLTTTSLLYDWGFGHTANIRVARVNGGWRCLGKWWSRTLLKWRNIY